MSGLTFTAGKSMSPEKRLRRDIELKYKDGGQAHVDNFLESFGEAMQNDASMRNRFSIRQLFEELMPGGREMVDSWNPRYGGSGAIRVPEMELLEGASSVTAGAFANISGQFVYSTILQAFMSDDYVFSKLVDTVSTQFNGEQIPGISRIGDAADEILEGKPYPRVGLNEDYIRTPTTQKRGMMIDLTREAVFFDRTGLIAQRAQEVGTFLGYNKEVRLINAFIDENVTRHRYNWKGTTYATYQSATPWINVKTTTALVDWTSVDAAEQILAGVTDPYTGLPIINTPKHLVVGRARKNAAGRITRATTVKVTTPGYATSANPTQTEAANPIESYQIVTSLILTAQMGTKTNWYLGDINKSIKYMENFPLQVEQAPVGSSDMWERDIAMCWKAGERGAAVVVEPRVNVKCSE